MTPLAVRKKRSMTEEEVIQVIRAGQNGHSLREYAGKIGISAQYLSDIYAGKRSPGDKILIFFGISKKRMVVVEYVSERKG